MKTEIRKDEGEEVLRCGDVESYTSVNIYAYAYVYSYAVGAVSDISSAGRGEPNCWMRRAGLSCGLSRAVMDGDAEQASRCSR